MNELPAAARQLPPGLFEGSVVAVTGGGTGLGLEMSRGLAALGATVAIASRSAEHHGAFLDEARERGWRAESAVIDVRESATIRAWADDVVQRHGKVDVLINNAAGNFVCPSERLSDRAWRAVLGIALDGAFFGAREFGKHMLARGSGQILNVLATYAWTGMPGVVHSAAAKAGLLAVTRTLAVEWGPRGVRTNAIAPGPFESEGAERNLWPDDAVREHMEKGIPLGRFATATEVAQQALFLLSPACAYVNGECFVMDGGASLGRSFWPEGVRLERKR
ncbi:MAG: SDR family oxidoreductase [Planctomycetota bacterium]